MRAARKSTKDYFAFWIFIAVIWALVASFIIIALPIWESKDQILAVARCAHTTFSRRRGTHTVHYPHPHTPIARLRGLITSYPPEHIYGERWL